MLAYFTTTINYSYKMVTIKAPRAVFTTLHSLCKLQMGPISYNVTITLSWKGLPRTTKDKHSSLLGQFLGYKENQGLWIWLLVLRSNTIYNCKPHKQLLPLHARLNEFVSTAVNYSCTKIVRLIYRRMTQSLQKTVADSIITYFATAISYDRKMFISLAPWKWINEESLIASNLAKSIRISFCEYVARRSRQVKSGLCYKTFYNCN